MPTITVIIPAKNSASTISKSIDSVISQSKFVEEIVIIENGSTDDTYEIVNKIKNRESRIVLKSCDPGVSRARNYGIKIAKGDYIAFLDADDTFRNHAMELLSSFVTDREVDFVKGNLVHLFGEYSRIWRPKISAFNRVSCLEREPHYTDFVGTVCGLYRREFLQNLEEPFPNDVRTAEDRAFVWKTLLQGAKFIHVGNVIYNYDRTSKTSVLKSIDGPHFDLFKAYSHVLKQYELPDRRAIHKKFWHQYVAMMDFTYQDRNRLSRNGRKLWLQRSRDALKPIENTHILKSLLNSASGKRKRFLEKLIVQR